MSPLIERSKLRQRADRDYKEYRAILILLNALTGHERERIDKTLERLPTLSRSKLREVYAKVHAQLATLKRKVGARADLPAYKELLSKESPPGEILYVPKYEIQKSYFRHYERAFPIFASLPPHALIGVDSNAVIRPSKPALNFRLLEATLFEDMALSWNSSVQARVESERAKNTIANKWFSALLRTTVRSAFFLLDGYIKGLAFDVLIASRPEDLSDEMRTLLEEWDRTRNKPKLLTLRDKLVQYPRIAMGVEHPPLQESNCPEMALVLEKEESLRHRLVHPVQFREEPFFRLSEQEAAQLIDATISLIKKISGPLGESFGRVEVWLYDRAADGRFPKEAFD
jgi:hypothetical protein